MARAGRLAGVVEATYLRGEQASCQRCGGSARRAVDCSPVSTHERYSPIWWISPPSASAERVLLANDEFFAPKENLLKPEKPVWREGEYTDRGKWMDGWETRRRRVPGHDWCIVRLGVPGVVRGVVVDTSFFRATIPSSARSRPARMAGTADAEALAAGREVAWTEILPRSALRGDAKNPFAVDASRGRVTHLRLNIYPDGGVARLRVHGEAVPDPPLRPRRTRRSRRGRERRPGRRLQRHVLRPPAQPDPAGPLDAHGRRLGDEAPPRARATTGRSCGSAARGTIERVEVDTDHFKGNAPESCSLEVCDAAGSHAGTAFGWRSGLDHAAAAHAAPGRCPAPVRRVGWSGHPRAARDLSRRRDRAASALRERGGVTLTLARLNALPGGGRGAAARLLRVVPLGRGDARPPAVREHGPAARGSR